MTLNIDRDLVKQMVSEQFQNKSRHLDELTHELTIWSCDTGQWLSCFDSCQLTKLWMSNIQDVDLPRHAWDTSPSLLMVSPTLPLQSVDAYVRSVNHVTTKRKEVDHIPWVWGSLGAPLIFDLLFIPSVLFLFCETEIGMHKNTEMVAQFYAATHFQVHKKVWPPPHLHQPTPLQ